ncbi:concanavalin A-like lectin/glucanase domain-containing protein [Globomyces pollinis-pini]|nr:concanavalin A-like lectin/glucanase domain-containing protein [Globomyces pollinis-pini]
MVYVIILGNPGVITSFITMSDVEDEIDWEITGKPNVPQSNVFYHSKGKTDIEKEIGIHGGEHPIDDTSKMHTYVIDWKHDSITWSIDGKVVRTLMKEKSFSKLNPLGPKWFPTTPSLVQFALWDGGYPGSSEGTRNWAGGAIDWGSKQELVANYESVMIECYDEKDNIVPKWPLNTPDKKEKTAKSNDKGGSNGSKTTPQGSALRHSSVWLAVASVLFSLC